MRERLCTSNRLHSPAGGAICTAQSPEHRWCSSSGLSELAPIGRGARFDKSKPAPIRRGCRWEGSKWPHIRRVTVWTKSAAEKPRLSGGRREERRDDHRAPHAHRGRLRGPGGPPHRAGTGACPYGYRFDFGGGVVGATPRGCPPLVCPKAVSGCGDAAGFSGSSAHRAGLVAMYSRIRSRDVLSRITCS
jgi:hypothetical protein